MATQREVDEAGIRRQIEGLVDGITAKDLEALRRSYAPDVVSFDVEPPLQHVGIEAQMENLFPETRRHLVDRSRSGLRPVRRRYRPGSHRPRTLTAPPAGRRALPQ